jgi:hypothetical protein
MGGRLRERVETEANRVLRERVARLRQTMEASLAVMGQALEFPLNPGEWGAAEGAGPLQVLNDAVDSIARRDTQREILAALLDAAVTFYPRAALFILKGGTLAGWAGLGFTGKGGPHGNGIPRLALPLAGTHLLARAAQSRALQHAGAEGPGAEVVSALGGAQPHEACAVPILVRGRPAAVLYGDTGTNRDPGQAVALEIVARIAGLALDRLLLLARRPRPAAQPGAPTPPEDAEMQALLVDLVGHPQRETGDDGMSDEERRRHADARRFARLLISEILLYNEDAVIQGRRNRDLTARLRKEIERSRQAYSARFPTWLEGGTDYFDQELVRQLAQGDRDLLGN